MYDEHVTLISDERTRTKDVYGHAQFIYWGAHEMFETKFRIAMQENLSVLQKNVAKNQKWAIRLLTSTRLSWYS